METNTSSSVNDNAIFHINKKDDSINFYIYKPHHRKDFFDILGLNYYFQNNELMTVLQYNKHYRNYLKKYEKPIDVLNYTFNEIKLYKNKPFTCVRDVLDYFLYVKNEMCGLYIDDSSNCQKIPEKFNIPTIEKIYENYNFDELNIFNIDGIYKLFKFVNNLIGDENTFCKTKFKNFNFTYRPKCATEIRNIRELVKKQIVTEEHQWIKENPPNNNVVTGYYDLTGGSRQTKLLKQLRKTLKTKKALRRQKKH